MPRIPRLMKTLRLTALCSLTLAPTMVCWAAPVERYPGKIIWADLVTPDLKAAEQFYTGLFGWTFQSSASGKTDYAIALQGGRAIGGVWEKAIPPGEHRQPAWLTFIAVRDVDAADRIAIAHGAKNLAPPKSFTGRGRQAVLADPEGAVFAMLATPRGDPPDELVDQGQWIWSSLLANDPQASAQFYQTVFGYQVFDLPSDDSSVHELLASNDYARGSVNSLPAGGHRHPHWLNFIRVPDASVAVAKAQDLGGRLLVAPFTDRHGGKIAVVADPSGAPIGLMEWHETNETRGDAK